MSDQLKESLTGHFGKTLWAQLFFIITYLPYFSQHPLDLHLLCLSALMFGGLMAWKKWRLPFIWQVTALGFGGWVVFQHYGTFRGLEPGLSFLAFLVCIKMVELRTERDLFIFFFISLTLLVGHLLNIYSFLGIAHFLFAVAFMLLMMMCFHNKKSWHWPQKYHIKILGALYLLTIPQAVFLFLFFPRFYVGHFQFPSVVPQSKLGFTDKLRPGAVSSVIEDQSAIFRVRFKTTERPEARELYWRGAVLQETDGFNWDRGEAPVHESFLEHYEKQVEELNTTVYQVDFATNESDVGFTLGQTYKVESRSRARLSIDPGEVFSLRPRSSQKISYDAYSLAQRGEPPKYGKLDLRPYLEVPENLPARIQDYAFKLKEQFSQPQELVDELMQRFQEENFVYTLSPGSYTGPDAMAEFFFERKRGFCEHYASISALIFRLAGVPARIVTGFQGGVYNEFGDYFIIRGEDAHAWMEVFIEDKGWVRYDPVSYIAPQRIELGASLYYRGLNLEDGTFNESQDLNASNTFWGRVRLQWDAWYYGLNQFFIGYDQESQVSFFERLGFPKFSPGQLLTLSFGLVFIFGLGALAIFSRGLGLESDESKLWRRFFLLLKKRGVERHEWEAPLSFGQRAFNELKLSLTEDQKRELLDVFEQLIKLSYARRSQERSIDLKRVRQQLKRLNKR